MSVRQSRTGREPFSDGPLVTPSIVWLIRQNNQSNQDRQSVALSAAIQLASRAPARSTLSHRLVASVATMGLSRRRQSRAPSSKKCHHKSVPLFSAEANIWSTFSLMAASMFRGCVIKRYCHIGIVAMANERHNKTDNKSEYKALRRTVQDTLFGCGQSAMAVRSPSEREKKRNKTETIFKLISAPYFHWPAFIIDVPEPAEMLQNGSP